MKDSSRRCDLIKITGFTDNSLHSILEWFPDLVEKRKNEINKSMTKLITILEKAAALCQVQRRALLWRSVCPRWRSCASGVLLWRSISYSQKVDLKIDGNTYFLSCLFRGINKRLRGALCFRLKKNPWAVFSSTAAGYRCSSNTVGRTSAAPGAQ